MVFGGWPDEALAFYEGLEADNSKSYWTSHKAVYDGAVLAPMRELAEELAAELGGEPKIFRPYRDIRFSSDKTPYKTHIGATIGSAYIHFDADGLGTGAGRWHLEPRGTGPLPGRRGRRRQRRQAGGHSSRAGEGGHRGPRPRLAEVCAAWLLQRPPED